jgi:flagella basal body P-ring formation protein FlgA
MLRVARILVVLACFSGICFPLEALSLVNENQRGTREDGKQQVSESVLREAFFRYVQGQLRKDRSDMALSSFKVTGNRPVPAGDVNIQLYEKRQGTLKGNARLGGIIRVNGKDACHLRLSAWVDVFEPVVCASRDLEKKERIREKDLYLARKNVSHLSSEVLTDMTEAVGLTAKRAIKSDACLKKWMLEKPSAVERGDLVTILAEAGALRVTVSGTVMEKGYLGEVVKVKSTMSKKVIYAKVINSKTVWVDF